MPADRRGADWSKRDQATARRTIREILSGARGSGRNASSKLLAARLVLGVDEEHPDDPRLSAASDEQLLAEVSRRALSVPAVDLDAAERKVEEAQRGSTG